MRESTFGDYLMMSRDRSIMPYADEPFMGLEPDGFFGESNPTEPLRLNGDEEE